MLHKPSMQDSHLTMFNLHEIPADAVPELATNIAFVL